jgi:branched-chain amino acid transport system substrate-binding protein
MVAGLVLVFVAAGCTATGTSISSTRSTNPSTSTTGVPRPDVDGELRIGALLPMTGDGAALGPSLLAGFRMAVEQINAAGGFNGRKVVPFVADEAGDPATAAVALDQLVNHDEVDAIVGPVSTRVTLSLLSPIAADHVLACSPTNTAGSLSNVPDDGYYVRTAPPDSLEALALGRAIAETGGRSTAIIYIDDDYGRNLTDALAAELVRQGNDVVDREAVDPEVENYQPQLAAMLAKDPAAIAYIGVPDPGVRVLSTLHQLGVRPEVMPVFVSDGMRVEDLVGLMGSAGPGALAGIQGTAMAPSRASATSFRDQLAAFAPGVPNLYASYAFDCTNLIALAAASINSDDPSRLRSAVIDVSRGGMECRDFPSCDALLAQGKDIDLDGASGPIELGSNGDPGWGTFDLFRYDAAGRETTERQIPVHQG